MENVQFCQVVNVDIGICLMYVGLQGEGLLQLLLQRMSELMLGLQLLLELLLLLLHEENWLEEE